MLLGKALVEFFPIETTTEEPQDISRDGSDFEADDFCPEDLISERFEQDLGQSPEMPKKKKKIIPVTNSQELSDSTSQQLSAIPENALNEKTIFPRANHKAVAADDMCFFQTLLKCH